MAALPDRAPHSELSRETWLARMTKGPGVLPGPF